MHLVLSITGDPHRLDNPAALALDRAGNLYVVDAGNARIQVFGPDGQFLRVLGSLGSGEGQFDFRRPPDFPGGVAVDGRGHVYVADNANKRIQVFDAGGRFVRQWGSQGTGDGQFLSPIDLEMDIEDRLYVVDDKRDDVQVFTTNGTFLFKFGGHGAAAGQFSFVGGLALAEGGESHVYVADFGNHRIQVFDARGKFLRQWGEKGAGPGDMDDPCDVAIDAEGNVYVTQYVAHDSASAPRVQKFNPNGRLLAAWGNPRYAADGLFAYVCGIAVDSEENVYVVDIENDVVYKFRLR